MTIAKFKMPADYPGVSFLRPFLLLTPCR